MNDGKVHRHAAKVDASPELNEAAQRTMELVYFAHIEQAYWADQVLAKYGIGRPHHRVLYFSNKSPGVSVRELMHLLRITNQALARTINLLVTLGFLEQRYSQSDRRVRQHFLSKRGTVLLAKLTRHQVEQVAGSMAVLDPQAIGGLWFGLEALMRAEDRKWLLPRPSCLNTDALGSGVLSNATTSGASNVVARRVGNGGGRLDRDITSAIKNAGTKRRQT